LKVKFVVCFASYSWSARSVSVSPFGLARNS
jgi:hypothetical protein